MEIIGYSSSRAKQVVDLFYMSVHAIDSLIYSQEQKYAWAAYPVDYGAWQSRLALTKPYLLFIDGDVAGFIELAPDGHIDCLYVSPVFQRKGVATALLNHVICVANKRGIEQLYAEVSLIAKPLFEKFGFLLQHENNVVRNTVELVNFTMSKRL